MSTPPFLDRLSGENRDWLFRNGIRRQFSGRLVAQGDPDPDAVVIILRGLVKITVLNGDGTEALVELRGSGDIIGATEALDPSVRETTVTTCRGPAEILVMRLEQFNLHRTHPEVADALNAVLAYRLRKAVRRQARALQPGPTRLASLLCELADEHGHRRDDDTVVLDAELTQGELGAAIGASRETVERALRNWRQRGIISTGYRRIIFHNMPYLRGLDDAGQAWQSGVPAINPL